jgi:hypothetical protein
MSCTTPTEERNPISKSCTTMVGPSVNCRSGHIGMRRVGGFVKPHAQTPLTQKPRGGQSPPRAISHRWHLLRESRCVVGGHFRSVCAACERSGLMRVFGAQRRRPIDV